MLFSLIAFFVDWLILALALFFPYVRIVGLFSLILPDWVWPLLIAFYAVFSLIYFKFVPSLGLRLFSLTVQRDGRPLPPGIKFLRALIITAMGPIGLLGIPVVGKPLWDFVVGATTVPIGQAAKGPNRSTKPIDAALIARRVAGALLDLAVVAAVVGPLVGLLWINGLGRQSFAWPFTFRTWVLVAVIYFTIIYPSFGQRLVRLTYVMQTGGRPKVPARVLRGLIFALTFPVGWITLLFPKRQAFWELVSGTTVLPTADPQAR